MTAEDRQIYISRMVHDLVVSISDLSLASRSEQSAPLILQERDDLELAYSELGRLVERLQPVKHLEAAE